MKMKKITRSLLALAVLAAYIFVPAIAAESEPSGQGSFSFSVRGNCKLKGNVIDTTTDSTAWGSAYLSYEEVESFKIGEEATTPQFVRVELDLTAGEEDVAIRISAADQSDGLHRTTSYTIGKNESEHFSVLVDLKNAKTYGYAGETAITNMTTGITAWDAAKVSDITKSTLFLQTSVPTTNALTVSNAEYYTYDSTSGYTVDTFKDDHLAKITNTGAATVVSRNNQTGSVTKNEADNTYVLTRKIMPTGNIDNLVGVTLSHPKTTYDETTAVYTMLTFDVEQLQRLYSFLSHSNNCGSTSLWTTMPFEDFNRFHNVTIITDLKDKKIYYYGDGVEIDAKNDSQAVGTEAYSEKYDARFYSRVPAGTLGDVARISNAKYTVYSHKATLEEIQAEANAHAARVAELNKGSGKVQVTVYPEQRGNASVMAASEGGTDVTVAKVSNNQDSVKFVFPYTVKLEDSNVKYLHFSAKTKKISYAQGINNMCVESETKPYLGYFLINDAEKGNKIDVIYDIVNKKAYMYLDGYFVGEAKNSDAADLKDIAFFYSELTNNADSGKTVAQTNFSDCAVTYYYTKGNENCSLDVVKAEASITATDVNLNGIVITAPSDAAENGNRIYPALHGDKAGDYVLYIVGYDETGALKECVTAEKAMVNIMPAKEYKAYFWKKENLEPKSGVTDIVLQTTAN